MNSKLIHKVISFLMAFSLMSQQVGFCQGLSQLDMSKYLGSLPGQQQPGRPLHLRYFSYNPLTDDFQILLDKSGLKEVKDSQIKEEGKALLKYFLIGVSLSNENFWVNLRPDSENEIITEELARTDLGKVLLEADLQLKKDVAHFSSPETPTGREYWNRLYQKAGEIFGSENVNIPTLTRPWIVPAEVIIREVGNSAYIYKATLKVMLEQDHLTSQTGLTGLTSQTDYAFKDPRAKALNEYSSQLVREKIIPKLTKEVNSSSKYASLRQAFYSLILSRWFKSRFVGKPGVYSKLINSHNLFELTSYPAWSKTSYFKEYKKSFTSGEYNINERLGGRFGGSVRSYFSGGIDLGFGMPGSGSSPVAEVGTLKGTSPVVSKALGNGMADLSGTAQPGEIVPDLTERLAYIPIKEYGVAKDDPVPPIMVGSLKPEGEQKGSSPLQARPIRTDFTVPEGQAKEFFTHDHHSYRIAELFAQPVEQIPDQVVNAVRRKLDQGISEGKILSQVVMDSGATDIDIHVTHRYGELNAAVQRLTLEAVQAGCLKAQELGLLRRDININSMSLEDLAKALRVKYVPHSIKERGAEPVVIARIIGAGIGAADIKLYHEFFITGATPLQKLGFVPEPNKEAGDKDPVRGFRAIVRRTQDVLSGKLDGDVWEFEKSAAAVVKGKAYTSVDQSLELLAFASQPNDYLITSIYTVGGSLLPTNEPVVSVSYQPVYGEKGDLRTLNPTFICRSQSGADAVGGVASMFYDVNFVPGGPKGENFVTTRPATLKEARKAPKEGTAHVVVYGWQSKLNGVIPRETGGILDHVTMNPPAAQPFRKLADWLASVMTTHPNDQPYLAPFAAQARVEPLRNRQHHLFNHAPKEADIDPVMDDVEAKVASGEYLSVTDDKADMGGKFGHNYTPEYMLAIDVASARLAQEEGKLTDGNIIGFVDNVKRLRNGTTNTIGDDEHILMLGDKSRNSAESHQISFTALVRGYLASMVGNAPNFDPEKLKPEKPYGRAQDFAGKEAKAAMKNPYFYSQFSERFFEILRETMPLDYMQMVENLEEGWRHWQQTKKETVQLEKGFSGNVSNQGLGTARYLMDIAGGERTFGVLGGDKMGPAGINRVIREGVYAALNAGEFPNGLVFEIWDAKAFDEHGNIPLDKLPQKYADVEDSVNELKDEAERAVMKGYYDGPNSTLREGLSVADREWVADLLKKSGYVPTERIYLDAQQDKDAIYTYLADSDRFNIKQVWSKKLSGWDINNSRLYLDRPVLGSSVTKLGILAGGEYIGKDDPVMVGILRLMEYLFAFLRENPLLLQGDMNGSHWLGAIPTSFKYSVASSESHPILVGFRYTLSEDGKRLAKVEDVFGSEFSSIRSRMFEFNRLFKQACLGGQFEPYGTNWRTVEQAYPLARLLRALSRPDSPFLVKNKPDVDRTLMPIGVLPEEIVELFKVATAPDFTPGQSGTSGAAASSAAASSPTRDSVSYSYKALPSKLKYIIRDIRNNAIAMRAVYQVILFGKWTEEFTLDISAETATEIVLKRINRLRGASELQYRLNWHSANKLLIELVTASSPVSAARQRPTFGGNWKLRPFASEEDARAKAREFRAKLAPLGDRANIVIFVEDRWMKAIAEEWEGSNISVGVQSFHFDPKGNIQQQIEDAVYRGAKYAMIGHSMHRSPNSKVLPGVAALTNEGANKILKSIWADGRLNTWYIIGVDEYEDMPLTLPAQEGYIKDQIDDGVNIGLDGASETQLADMTITAEPMRDISTKAGDGVIDPKTRVNFPKVEMLARLLSDALRTKFGKAGEGLNTGYGASASPDTSETLLSHPDVWNILPGGKSLEADDFYAIIENGIKGKADSSSPASTSSPLAEGRQVGGIDFRAINSITQPMGNLSGLNLSLPRVIGIESFDLNQEFKQLHNMLQAGLLPSGDRLKEFVAACYQKGQLKTYLTDIVGVLVSTLKLQEEDSDGIEKTSNELKEVLLIVDSAK